MKHIKVLFAIAIFSVVTLFSSAVKATNDEKTDTNNLPVELKYVGKIKNQPLFQLDFSGSARENEFDINITDQNGLVLYSNLEKGEKFSKQFLLDTEDLGDAVLKFEITGRKSGKSVSYRISRKSVVLENMDVVKL